MGIQIWGPTRTFGKVAFLFNNKVTVANSAELNSSCQEWEL